MTTEQQLSQLVQVTARLAESSESQRQMMQEGFSTLTDKIDTLAGQVSELTSAVQRQGDHIGRLVEMNERQWQSVERLLERQDQKRG